MNIPRTQVSLVAAAFAAFFAQPLMAMECPENLPLIEPGKLTMSINATLPPIQYIDNNGELVGLNRDMGDEIAKRMCLEPKYINVSFEVQIPGLASDRWDMINTGLFYTEDRTKIMHLIPVRVVALAMIAQGGNPLNLKSPEDLAGRVVGVEIAGAEEKQLRALNDKQVANGMEPMDIRVFNNYGDAFLALSAGQVDAIFAADSTGAYYQKRGQFTMAATGLLAGTATTMAVDEEATAQAIVDALNEMLEDGTYDRLMENSGATKVDAWSKWSGKFEYHYNPDS
uniref:ABC transporter substrate-binding protein n=1 Tax=Pararhizobium sp. IMCC3301 TaxID=3067904 RepID=UPI002741E2D9|nr:ABC transporter substrate-binding protein [Pararhizobium sp. IMCC3301]